MRTHRIPWQGKDRQRGALRASDQAKRDGLARTHRHAPHLQAAAELFERGAHKVVGAHGHAADGDEGVGRQRGRHLVDVESQAVTRDAEQAYVAAAGPHQRGDRVGVAVGHDVTVVEVFANLFELVAGGENGNQGAAMDREVHEARAQRRVHATRRDDVTDAQDHIALHHVFAASAYVLPDGGCR